MQVLTITSIIAIMSGNGCYRFNYNVLRHNKNGDVWWQCCSRKKNGN